VQAGDAKPVAERVSLRPVAAGEALIDDGDEIAAGVFGCVPDAAAAEWDLQRGEVLGADEMDAGLLGFPIAGAGDIDSHLLTAVGRRRSNGGAADAGHCGNLLLDLINECSASLTRLDALPGMEIPEVHHDAGLHDVIGLVPEWELGEIEKAADGGARCCHKKESECDLRGDERAPAMLCGRGGETMHACGQSPGEVRARETQRRDDTEEQAGDERERDGEGEDEEVDAENGFLRKGIRRQLHGQFREPVRCGDPEYCASERDDDRFDQQLTDDTPTAGADGRAHGELVLTGAAAGEQKDGAVGAANDEQ
jgi:hypothetical protein